MEPEGSLSCTLQCDTGSILSQTNPIHTVTLIPRVVSVCHDFRVIFLLSSLFLLY
jgi:hypothetical protein